MNRFLFLITISFLSLGTALGQTLDFGIYFGDKEVGTIKAIKKKEGSITKFIVSSESAYKTIIYDYQRTTYLTADFKDENLYYSRASVRERGELEDSVTTKKVGNVYQCFHYPNNEKFELDFPIKESSAMLYHKEPVGITKVFAEGYQTMAELKSLGNHQYKLFLPNGKTNLYTYKNGKLISVEVPRLWFTLMFKRENS